MDRMNEWDKTNIKLEEIIKAQGHLLEMDDIVTKATHNVCNNMYNDAHHNALADARDAYKVAYNHLNTVRYGE